MKHRLPALAPIALAALSACGVDTPEEAPQLLVPEDVEVHWDRSFNGVEDGLVALVPVDVMIYEAATGEPLGDTPLLVASLHGDAAIVAPDDVLPVDPDESGAYVWDAWRDRYFAFVDEAIAPGSLRVRTDEHGLARVYVLADAFPEGDGGFGPVPIVVSMGVTDDTFLLVPR